MKILTVGDVHWSTYSSIIRSRGDKYSTRLENLINSVNWAESIAVSENVDKIVYLGDFFDKADLTSEEISALNEIKWCSKEHIFIAGNHEMGRSDHKYSSSHIFRNLGLNFRVMDIPYVEGDILYLPYILEDDRKPLEEYLEGKKVSYIFSHNDIKDFQMGAFKSTEGFSIEEIKSNCNMFINGHLHNGGWVEPDSILNVGNLTGQNFSEDALKYDHNVFILDTDTGKGYNEINTKAFNFYKFSRLGELKSYWNVVKNNNPVISCSVYQNELAEAKELTVNAIVRFTIKAEESNSEISVKDLHVDHISKFIEFCNEKLENSEVVKEEVSAVCR